ncbi:MAG: SPOR domain-containing protein [Treponema sp.]|jgi:hypothetical protein|nr:SPOR domain-containing protein [Treponema sp.]
MKKRYITIGVLGIVLLLSGSAFGWEGAAAVVQNGDVELPETGYYAAVDAKSYPRNTVVEITNLATEQTIQVTVFASFDTPGLLAVLSQDAAAAIGLQTGSIGRIKMIQAKDRLSLSPSSTRDANSPETPPDVAEAVVSPETQLAEAVGPGLPADRADPSQTPMGESPPADTPPVVVSSGNDTGREPDSAWDNTLEMDPALGRELADATGPSDRSIMSRGETETGVEQRAGSPNQRSPTGLDGFDLALIPAGEQPPEETAFVGLPPEAEIAPLPDSRTVTGSEDSWIDPALIIAPIDETASLQSGPEPGTAQSFSVPMIMGLEKGRYYLQLGAYSKPESVERELSRIGRSYPLTIQKGGPLEKPFYRILLGPLNLGESGALLQRFKGSGWSDAFIRQGIN